MENKVEIVFEGTVDKQSFNSAEQYARDTGKKIDKDLKLKLELDIAETQQKLKDLRALLRSKDLTGKQKIDIQIEANRAQRDLTNLKRQLNNLENTGDKSVSRLKKLFESVGPSITRFLVNPITLAVAGLGGLIKALSSAGETARSFESAFAGVKKTFDDTAQGYVEIDKGLRKLSYTLPLTYEELAGIAEVSGQLGVKGRDNLLKFTEVAAGLGIATNLSAEEAATSLKRFADVLNVPVSQIENLGSALVGLGNNFAANENEILDFAKKTQTAGIVSSLTATQILGLSTALVASGINAEAGGTAMVQAFDKINTSVAKGGEELNKFATVAGMSADEFSKAFKEDAGNAFAKFLEGLKKSGGDAGQVMDELGLSSTRMRQALLASAGNVDTLKDALKKANVEFENNTALQDEVNKRLETMDSRLAVTKNKWRSFSADIGKTVNSIWVPVFERLVDSTIRLTKQIGASINYLGQVFNGITATLSATITNINVWFSNVVDGIKSYLNKAIGRYNKFADKIGVTKIEPFQVDEKSLVKGLKASSNTVSAFSKAMLKTYGKQKDEEVKISNDSNNQKIQLDNKLLQTLQVNNDKKASGIKKVSSIEQKAFKESERLLDSNMSKYDKLNKEIQKLGGSYVLVDEAILKNKDSAKEFFDEMENYKQALKGFSDKAQAYYDKLTDKINQSRDAQQKLKDDIAGIDNDIAKRVVDIDKQLEDLRNKTDKTDEDLKKIDSLEYEKKVAFEGMTDEEKAQLQQQIDDIAEYESLTKVEQLKRDKEAKIQALEEQQALEQQYIENRMQLENILGAYIKKKADDEIGLANQVRKAWEAVSSARAGAVTAGASSTTGRATGGDVTGGTPYTVGEYGPEIVIPQSNATVIPNKNIVSNVNVTANNQVASNVDVDLIADSLARKIKLSQMGLYN